MNRIYFVSGVCGVGKSSIIPYLRELLPQDKYVVYDFDSRGVPENADRNWRISESRHWLEEGTRLSAENMSTIICGFMKPTDWQDLINANTPEIKVIILDAQPEIVRQRLIARYTKDGIFDESQIVVGRPVKRFIDDNVWLCGQMKDIYINQNYEIVETSNLTPEEVAQKVVNIIQGKDMLINF